jgi:hypothetical protein
MKFVFGSVPAVLLFGAILLSGAATTARAETVVVTVPGNALGNFGNPACCSQPFVRAFTFSKPGTLTITYLSGTVTDAFGINTGPEGVYYSVTGNQFPLQEAVGIAGGPVDNFDSLIGIVANQARVLNDGFQAVDGSKGSVAVGLEPSHLFFVGTGKTITVDHGGALFLGVNDDNAESNGGGFTVSIQFVPAQ